jgi:uncharacterized protein (TIGR02001 family)
MKIKTLIPALILSAALVPAAAMAEVSANIGWASEYIFRGVFQEDSSAYAGIDYANDSGFYLGAWGADVGLGNEIDYYLGYSAGNDDFTWKVGYTLYTYTDDFDGDYGEVNLGIGAGIFAADLAIGEYDPLAGGPSIDYNFLSVTLSPEKGPYYKLGLWGDDFEDRVLFPNAKTFPSGGDGDYLEIGYVHSMEDSGVDLSIAWTYSSDLIVNEGATGDYALVFGIKKSFAIGGN